MKKLTTEDFKIKAIQVHGNKYDYSLVEYVNGTTNVIIICPLHGKFELEPTKHLYGNRGCQKCGLERKAYLNTVPKKGRSLLDKFPKLCEEWSDKNKKSPNEYRYRSHAKVYWKCNKCNHEWECTINQHTLIHKNTKEKIEKPSGCPRCHGNFVVTDENNLSNNFPELLKEWDYIENNKLPEKVHQFSSKYAHWQCSKCNHKWKAVIANRTRGNSGCPYCYLFKGPKKIEEYLKANKIQYILEYKDERCKYKDKLRFDFAIINEDEELLGLIEFNGQQHYTPIDYFGGVKQFKLLQKRDKIKIKFCNGNNIPLLIIPYTKFNNIEKLIEDFINDIKDTRK